MVRRTEIIDPGATSAQSGGNQSQGQVPLGISKTTDKELLEQLAANARADKPYLKEFQEIVHRIGGVDMNNDFPLRDMYNRLVNEIRQLAKKADAWVEVEVDPVWQINRELQRIAAIYDPWE